MAVKEYHQNHIKGIFFVKLLAGIFILMTHSQHGL